MTTSTFLREPKPVKSIAVSGSNPDARIIYIDADRERVLPLVEYGRIQESFTAPGSYTMFVNRRFSFNAVLAYVEQLAEAGE